MSNMLKTTFFLSLLTILLVIMGGAVGGQGGMIVAFLMAGALRKLHTASQTIPILDARPATAHMFIVNPLTGGGLIPLFSTHPPMEERISRLEALATGIH